MSKKKPPSKRRSRRKPKPKKLVPFPRAPHAPFIVEFEKLPAGYAISGRRSPLKSAVTKSSIRPPTSTFNCGNKGASPLSITRRSSGS